MEWWVVAAFFALFSVPALTAELLSTVEYCSAPRAAQREQRTQGRSGLLAEIEAAVPADAPLLLDLAQRITDLHVDRQLNYWLYPRRVFSAHALRMRGEDVDGFIARENIRWVVRDESLQDLRPHNEEVQTRSSDTPQPIQAPSAFRGAVGVALGMLFFVGVGFGLISVTRVDELLSDTTERIAVAFLVGTAAVGTWTLTGFLLGLGVQLSFVLPCALVLPIGYVLRRWRAESPAIPTEPPIEYNPGGRGDRMAWMICLVLLSLMVLKAAAEPMFGADDRYQWAFKARIMLHEESPRGPGFSDPHTLHFHPRYPLLVPAIEAVLFRFAGGFDDQIVKVLFPLCLAGGIVVVVRGLQSFGCAPGSAVCALTLLLVPYYCGFGLRRDFGSGFTAYPDLILSAFLAASVSLWLRAVNSGHARLAGLAIFFLLAAWLTKAEGRVHVLILTVLMSFSWFRRRSSAAPLLRAVPVFLLAVFAVAAHEIAFTRRVPPGILPDNYAELFTWQRLAENLDRVLAVAAALARDLFFSPRMGFVGLLLAGACIIGRRQLRRMEVWVPLVYCVVMLVAFCVPYIVGPKDWLAQYAWSANRLISQILPCAFWTIGALLLPRFARFEPKPPPHAKSPRAI